MHVLDLEKDGEIKPHKDSVRVCYSAHGSLEDVSASYQDACLKRMNYFSVVLSFKRMFHKITASGTFIMKNFTSCYFSI